MVILHVYSSLFQSTLPRRERHSTRTTTQRKRTISIHAPAKGATKTVKGKEVKHKISIHAPAKGATAKTGMLQINIGISIHAPAKGATVQPVPHAPHRKISIHAPAKGATALLLMIPAISSDFNPRSREGSDNTTRYVYGSFSNFNPRSREGSDKKN